MDNAEKYEVAHPDRSRKGRDTKKSKKKKKRSRSTSFESSSSSSSSDSSDSSSDSDRDTKKKKNKKKISDKKVKDKKRMDRIIRAQGHVAADFDKPPNIKPAVRFAPTPPETKVLIAVNHISWEDEARSEPAEVEWPETVIVMKIETRSKRKANPKEVSSDVPPLGKKDIKKKIKILP
ncbi:hypothetical protein R1sor_021734 [Riccia sorocarpa]|uniref:Uncharacterized protein n=1 Tax=Riccia sorocarpa TaxID=122646 RepID=A0ABD3GHX0_9MARC